MRLFPPRHTAESVALELIEGLENGTIAFRPDTADVIAEIVRLEAEIDAAFARLDTERSVQPTITGEQLAWAEQHSPGVAYEYLLKRRDLRSKLAQLESRLSRAGQRQAICFAMMFLCGAIAAGFIAYLHRHRPYLVPAALFGVVVGILPWLLSWRVRHWLLRTLTGYNAKLFADVAELFQQASAIADLPTPN